MALTKSLNRLRTPAISERRRYPRFPFSASIRLRELNEAVEGIPIKEKLSHIAKIKNLGQGGVKIRALPPLTPQGKVLIRLNLKPLSVLIDTQDFLFVSPSELSVDKEHSIDDGKQILAEVAWRHLNLETGLFEAGLRFIEGGRRRDYESYITSVVQTACT